MPLIPIHFFYNSVCENAFLKIYLPSTKKSKLPSHQVFGVFALEVNKIMEATPPKLRRETGMCAIIILHVSTRLQFLFERSEFLIDTSQKKSLHACTRVRLLLVLVCGIMYHIRTYLISARLPRYVYVDTYVPGLHPRPQKKNRRPCTGSGSDTRTARQSLHSKVRVTTTASVTEGVPAVSWIQNRS